MGAHTVAHPPSNCSGGGAGGPGHPGTSACPPGTGGHGGGFIMIAALEFVNEGFIMSGGNNGFPDRNYCNWPNGNPQVGSGGGGAGGFIKCVACAVSYALSCYAWQVCKFGILVVDHMECICRARLYSASSRYGTVDAPPGGRPLPQNWYPHRPCKFCPDCARRCFPVAACIPLAAHSTAPPCSDP